MYVFKPPRPIEDYYIGKYHKGDCIYLITKEAYTNWKNQQVSVKHNVCLPEGEIQYSLKPNADYVAHRYENRPKEWDKIILRDCPYLIDVFAKVKAKPAPDDYYIVLDKIWKPGYGIWIVKRSDYRLDTNRIDNYSSWTNIPNESGGWLNTKGREPKKFPQLSSEVKAELQKLNPERYREWEDFYMKKYPNMQPLNAKPIGLPNPADDYIIVEAKELALVRRSKFIEGAVQWVYRFNYGWVEVKAKKGNQGEDAWPGIKDWHTCDYIRNILPQFKQYYSKLEQKKVVIAQHPQCNQDPNKYQVGLDLDIDEKAMEKNWVDLQSKIQLDKWQEMHEEVYGAMKNSIRLLEKKLGNTIPDLQIGKDQLTGQYLIGWDPYQADYETQGVITIWSRDSQGKLVNRLIELNLDEWNKDCANWFRNNRTSPLEFEKEVMNHVQYYGTVNLKARRVGQMTADAEWAKLEKTLDSLLGFIRVNKQYSPNLKQQNHEIINVPRKVITINSGQEYSRSSISSHRCPPTVTAEHTKYGQEPCRGQEVTGGCKIS